MTDCRLSPACVQRLLIADFYPETIRTMSKAEAFHDLLVDEGLIGYDRWIKKLVLDVYGVDLDGLALAESLKSEVTGND